jgi:3-deoxy-manno-octulosonate cytidylyltransferase (CMP-KDO synthetase)
MVEHVYRRASASRLVSATIVATDDERIRAAVTRFGGDARMTSASHASGTDRVAEVAASLDCDIVVNVQGDLPLIEPGTIDDVASVLVGEASLPMSTLRQRLDDPAAIADPNVVKVVVASDGDALYFSRAPVPFNRDGRPVQMWKHIGLYAYRRGFLLELSRLTPTLLERTEALEQLRVLEHGYRIRTVETTENSIEVDTPADLERVRQRVASMQGLRQHV